MTLPVGSPKPGIYSRGGVTTFGILLRILRDKSSNRCAWAGDRKAGVAKNI
jgi:hypothetical protein